jgi:hypothetical protein
MGKRLGTIVLLMLLSGHAVAQEPVAMTVRVFADGRPMLTVPPELSWGIDRAAELAVPTPSVPPPAAPRPEWKGPVELLLSLSAAF